MSHVPCGDLMSRPRRLPAASTWVLWSSPLLLIVLVLTLGSTSRAGTPSAPSLARAPAVTTSTSVTSPSSPRRVARRRVTPRPTSTTTSTTPTAPPAPTGPHPVSSTAASSSSTAASATASAGASATSGPVGGQLGGGLSSVVVPLAGPRTWTLTSSAPLGATLACGAQTATVAATFVVGSTPCQLALVDPTGQTVTWQLTPEG